MQLQNKILTWPEWRASLKQDDNTMQLINQVPDFDDVVVPEDYKQLWKDVSLEVQLRKAKSHNLTRAQTEQCLSQLCKRPYYLTLLAKQFNAKNIVEVGTAQGLQFYSFAKSLLQTDGKVWSCDVQDVRNKQYSKLYEGNTTFCLGTSQNLATIIDRKIDMYYIDGAHDYGDVIRDVVNLKDTQSDNCIWVFDDFDNRFGCSKDIKRLCEAKKTYKVYRVGDAASGNPNHQAIIFGKL